jgi:hypothetical protein
MRMLVSGQRYAVGSEIFRWGEEKFAARHAKNSDFILSSICASLKALPLERLHD